MVKWQCYSNLWCYMPGHTACEHYIIRPPPPSPPTHPQLGLKKSRIFLMCGRLFGVYEKIWRWNWCNAVDHSVLLFKTYNNINVSHLYDLSLHMNNFVFEISYNSVLLTNDACRPLPPLWNKHNQPIAIAYTAVCNNIRKLALPYRLYIEHISWNGVRACWYIGPGVFHYTDCPNESSWGCKFVDGVFVVADMNIYSLITFSYTKCFVHSYTVDVVFTLS